MSHDVQLITAGEAKKLAGLEDIKPALEYANEAIGRAAAAGHDHVILRGELFSGGYHAPPKQSYSRVEQILKAQGFKVSFYYEDGNQFSDMGMCVSWEIDP